MSIIRTIMYTHKLASSTDHPCYNDWLAVLHILLMTHVLPLQIVYSSTDLFI